MTLGDVRTRQAGSIEYALVIKGLPILPTTSTTHTWTIPGISGLTHLGGMLKRDGIRFQTKIDPKRGTMSHGDMTFHLVDATDALGTRNKITDIFGSGYARTGMNTTKLASTLAAGATTATVDSTTGFPSSGDIYIEKETIGYSGITPTSFTGLTRGKYGSRDVQHEVIIYDPDALNPLQTLIPEVTDRAVNFMNRDVALYSAVATSFTTLTNIEQRWLGAMKLPIVISQGAQFDLPCQSVWARQNTKVGGRERSAIPRNITIDADDRLVSWVDGTLGFGVTEGDFDFAVGTETFPDWASFVRQFVDELNESLVAGGASATLYLTEESEGQMVLRNSFASKLRVHVPATISLALVGDVYDLSGETFEVGSSTSFDEDPYTFTQTYQVIAMRDSNGLLTLQVDDASRFNVFAVLGGDGYYIFPIVTVQAEVPGGGRDYQIYNLVSVDTVTDTVTLGSSLLFGPTAAFLLVPVGQPVPKITQGIMIVGDFVKGWKGFIEASTIPADMRGYLNTNDFDWTRIMDESPGGMATNRKRCILSPTSFQDMFLEDLALAGMVPTVTSNGQIAATKLKAPLEIDFDFDVTSDEHEAGLSLDWQLGIGYVINQVVFQLANLGSMRGIGVGERLSPFGTLDIILNDLESQARLEMVPQERVIRNDAVELIDEALGENLGSVASELFALFSRSYAYTKERCTFAVGDVLAGDTVRISHWLPPDMTTGTRGVSNLICYVLGVDHAETDAKSTLEMIQVGDGYRRSGWAPAAKVTAYTLVGGVTHRLTLASGIYATDQAEGLYFGVSWKVLIKERDNFSPAADEAFTIAAVASDGLTVDIDAAPSAGMQTIITAGNAVLVPDEYDTASQVAAAKAYLHVCDDADNDIGTTTDDGFRPA